MKKNKFYYFLISGFALAGLTMAGCKEETKDPELPKIGGYNNSNEVAAANLKAHWTFDGTYVEDITKTAETSKEKASFVAGIKGQAVSLDRGYVYYAKNLAQLKTGGSFTISGWLQANNNGGETVSGAECWFQSSLFIKDKNFGNVCAMLETGRNKAASDTLIVKGIYQDKDGGTQDAINENGGVAGVDYKIVKGAGQNKWIQVILAFDGSNPAKNVLSLYANGEKVNNTIFEDRKASTFLFSPANEIIIGGWYNNIPGKKVSDDLWTIPFKGKIDEVRVFDKLLSLVEIKALYDIELVGR